MHFYTLYTRLIYTKDYTDMFKKKLTYILFFLLIFAAAFSVSSCKKDEEKSAVKSTLAINYLSEADYLSGSIDENLKKETEIAIGEKCFVVIDCTLSGLEKVNEEATATVKINSASKSSADFQLEIEEIPTSDYIRNGNNVEAAFKIHGSGSKEKTFRFILSLTAKSSGNTEISAEINSEFVTASQAKSSFKINHYVLTSSKLNFELSPDEKYYTVVGLGEENGEVITVPSWHNGKAVLEIADNVFSGVIYLKEITLSSGLEKIGASAFKGCTALKSIIIPSSVTVIGDGAFADCPNTDIYCEASAKPTGWKESFASPDAYITWGYHDCFVYKSVNNVFYYEFNYTNPNGVNISVPSTYKNAPVSAVSFSSCGEIRKIKLPETVTKIYDYSFKGCNNLNDITVSAENGSYKSVDGVLYTKDGKTLVKYSARKNNAAFVLPTGVENIAPYAFEKCTGVISICLPQSLINIADSAFSGCFKLIEVVNNSSNISVKKTDYGLNAFEVHSGETKLSNINGYSFYNYNGDNYLLGYNGNDTELILPSSYVGENYKIYKRAFYGNKALTSVTVPSSVISIGFSAFEGCNGLTSITLPFVGMTASNADSSHFGYIFGAPSYGDNAEYVPLSLKNLALTNAASIRANAFYQCTGLKSIIIPESVSSIGNNAFSECSSLTEIKFNAVNCSDLSSKNYVFYNAGKNSDGITVTFGDNVKNIPAYLFCPASSNSYSPNIKTVIIGNGVKAINAYAFAHCNNLTGVTFHGSVTSIIGEGAFKYCFALSDVDIPSGVTSIGSNAFAYCTKLKSVTIPENAASIGNGAFRDCLSLTDIDISSSVTSIGSEAFLNCTGLKSVTIPEKVVSIGTGAFRDCTALTDIDISSSVTSIGSEAFLNCTGLKSVTIPEKVVSIGTGAFRDCTALTEIKFNAVSCSDLSKDNYVFYSAGTSADGIIVTFGDNVTRIPTNLFCPYISFEAAKPPVIINIETVIIGKNVKTIGSHAFAYCYGITSIEIPSSVTSIGNSAFYDCDSLTSLIIGNGVTSIGSSAFTYCNRLTSIEIPSSVTSIGSNAFWGCSKLVEVINKSTLNIEKGSEDYGRVGYYPLEIHNGESKIVNKDGHLFYTVDGVNYLVNYIGNDTALTLPSDYNGENYKICKYAFYLNDKITSVVIPDRVTSIGSFAFFSCESLTSVVIGNSVTSIGNYAFHSCESLTSITIPNSVTSIGFYAFASCDSLKNITLEDTSTWYRTTSSTDWENKTGGTSTSVTNASTNATYFKSTYVSYYWYKK